MFKHRVELVGTHELLGERDMRQVLVVEQRAGRIRGADSAARRRHRTTELDRTLPRGRGQQQRDVECNQRRHVG